MKTGGLGKYYIGLAVIGLFAVGVLIFVLTLASGNKQDVKTDKSANDIATKLNAYVATKEMVPSSLSAAGITDVPSTISYTKLSDDSYKFCATYKASGNDLTDGGSPGLTAASVGSLAFSSAQGGSSFDNPSATSSELFINFSHKKGPNCQTVTTEFVNPGGLCLEADGSSCGPTLDNSTQTDTSSTDTERKDDAAGLLGAVAEYVSNNSGALPAATDITDLDGYVTVGSDPSTQSFALLNFYTKSTQFSAKQFAAGDSNSTDTKSNDNIILELGATCSGVNPAAGAASSYVVLYSTSAGHQCTPA